MRRVQLTSGQDELGRSGNKSLGAHWLRGFLLTSGQSRVQCQCRLGSCATNTSNSAECRKDAQIALLMARVTVTWQMSKCNWRHFTVKWSSNFKCGFDNFRQGGTYSCAVHFNQKRKPWSRILCTDLWSAATKQFRAGEKHPQKINRENILCAFSDMSEVFGSFWTHIGLKRLGRMDDTDEVILILYIRSNIDDTFNLFTWNVRISCYQYCLLLTSWSLFLSSFLVSYMNEWNDVCRQNNMLHLKCEW